MKILTLKGNGFKSIYRFNDNKELIEHEKYEIIRVGDNWKY